MADNSRGLRVVALPRKYVNDFQNWLDKDMGRSGLFKMKGTKKTIVAKTNVRFLAVTLVLSLSFLTSVWTRHRVENQSRLRLWTRN
jgi:hypothetical protein